MQCPASHAVRCHAEPAIGARGAAGRCFPGRDRDRRLSRGQPTGVVRACLQARLRFPQLAPIPIAFLMKDRLASYCFPRNLLEFTEQFATEQECRDCLMQIRWPRGFVCPRCEGTRTWPASSGQLRCASCKGRASATAGTLLNRFRIPPRGWILAMWLACTQKTGRSAVGLQRAVESWRGARALAKGQ